MDSVFQYIQYAGEMVEKVKFKFLVKYFIFNFFCFVLEYTISTFLFTGEQ